MSIWIFIQLICCTFMLGLIWTIQILHYPSFSYIKSEDFTRFARFHQRRISWIVLPVMVLELISAIFWAYEEQKILSLLNLVLLIMIWLSTFIFSVPCHRLLLKGQNMFVISRLVKTNWRRTLLWSLRFGLILTAVLPLSAWAKDSQVNFYNLSALDIDGKNVSMETFRNKVVLVVNVASQCGFTSQYAGLENLWQKYKDQGFVVLGFPSNQFGNQEPGSNKEIKLFCQENYKVSFPMFSKIEVNGEQAHPIYVYLKGAAPGTLGSEPIKWNFTKFLMARDGKSIQRFASSTKPEDLEVEIKKLLPKN